MCRCFLVNAVRMEPCQPKYGSRCFSLWSLRHSGQRTGSAHFFAEKKFCSRSEKINIFLQSRQNKFILISSSCNGFHHATEHKRQPYPPVCEGNKLEVICPRHSKHECILIGNLEAVHLHSQGSTGKLRHERNR